MTTFLWHDVEIVNPTVGPNSIETVSPEFYGFRIEHTGGNCTAWRLDMPDGTHLLVSDECSHILRAGEPAQIGHYDAEGEMLALADIIVGQLD